MGLRGGEESPLFMSIWTQPLPVSITVAAPSPSDDSFSLPPLCIPLANGD